MSTDQEIIEAVKSSLTMSEAAVKCKLHFNTFARRAKRLGVYAPNQCGKGLSKNRKSGVIKLDEILKGLHPSYQTFKLKHRLYREGVKKNECEICFVKEWQSMKLECELDHVNGDSSDHRLENLRILCPNCHSQTLTFRNKSR